MTRPYRHLSGRGSPPILATRRAGLPGKRRMSARLDANSAPTLSPISLTSGRMDGDTPVSR